MNEDFPGESFNFASFLLFHEEKEGAVCPGRRGSRAKWFHMNYQNETMAQVLFARFFLQEKARGFNMRRINRIKN